MYQIEELKNFKGLVHGISTKKEGNMSFRWSDMEEALKNREGFLDQLNIPLNGCVNMLLNHGTEVVRVDAQDKGRGMFKQDGIPSDALITKEKNLFLFLLTADCLPIIFYDQKNEVVALCHAGWKGVEGKIVKKVVEVFGSNYGSAPADIFVAIGPAVHKESFKFLNPIQKKMAGWKKFLEDLSDKQTSVDIVGYTVSQLIDVKIPGKNIAVSDIDTATSPDFFSHYRSVKIREPEGRFATVVGII